ncbi:MAG: hypothetical protein ACFFGZ_07565 [Candidatus Thorarchaeota archaeon]
MSADQSLTGNVLTEGLIVTMFMDTGPENVYNSSPLDFDEALGMILKNLTAIGTNEPLEYGQVTSHGPMPTPRKPYVALAFLFHLKAPDSGDPRIAQFGRVAVFWILAKSSTITKYSNVLQQMIRRLLHFYRVTHDSDLQKDDILKKIDEKLKIVEGGVETYCISEQKTVESFLDPALVPHEAPLLLIDNASKQIKILLRKEVSALRKTEIRQILNDFLKESSKGLGYQFEWVSDAIAIQVQLSKLGFEPQTAADDFEIRLYGQLTFEELDGFLASRLAPRRRQLVNRVLKSVESRTPLNSRELAAETGLSAELIEELLTSAIKSGHIQGARIENGLFHPPIGD